VPLKRSVFRLVKKFWGKKRYVEYKESAFFQKLGKELKEMPAEKKNEIV